ncbi:MAG: acyl carrier protein [Bryobacteraceae bacterium]
MLKDAREDWDSSIVVTDATGLFQELGFESIDAVGLSSTLEMNYDQTLPFPEFMNKAKTQGWKDITVGSLVDFLMENLKNSPERK